MAARDAAVRIKLLGPVRAERDGVELALGPAHRQAVLAALALRAGWTVSREELVTAVWDDAPPPSAAGSVYTYVSALRHTLEPGHPPRAAGGLLVSGGGGYRLLLRPDDVDALRFEGLRDTARGHRAAGEPAAERAALAEALGLWRGAEALAGVPGPHAATQRLRLAELRLATVERHAALALDAGDADAVVDDLQPLAAEHPLREGLHALLMTALERTGRRAEAVEVYHRAHDALVEQSGTEPSAALRQVYERVRTGSRRAVAVPGRSSALIGRGAELAVLHRAVTDVAAGRGGLLWLEGEPGIGKSALLEHALREATQLGCRVGRGLGDELAQRVPLSVLAECLPPDLPEQAELGAAAALSAWLGAEDVLDRVRALVRRLCADGPLVLAVDDLQWADDASVLAWEHLFPLTAGLPLLLVGATRPAPAREPVGRVRAALLAAGGEVRTIEPLDAGRSAELARALGGPRSGPALPQLAAELGAGNPRHLRAVVTAAARGEPLPIGDHPAGAVPAELTAAVAAHLEPLTGATRDVLRAAAFLGGDPTPAELAAVTGAPVAAAVEEALGAGLLSPAGPGLAFRHPLVRRVLHDGTPTAIRLLLHREYAEKLAVGGHPPERVAGQLLAGPVPVDDWSCRWLADTLDHLHGRAPDLAVALLRHATRDEAVTDELQIDLAARLARLVLRDGGAPQTEAGWVAGHASTPALRAEMRWILALAQHRRGADGAAAEVLLRALHDPQTPARWLARYVHLLGRLAAPAPRARAARRPGRRRTRRPADPPRPAVSVIQAALVASPG
jgi:DNA-binding SARP family transcriptional activator